VRKSATSAASATPSLEEFAQRRFVHASLSEFLNAMRISAFGPSGAVSQLKVFARDCLERHGWRRLGWHCGLNLLGKSTAITLQFTLQFFNTMRKSAVGTSGANALQEEVAKFRLVERLQFFHPMRVGAAVPIHAAPLLKELAQCCFEDR